MRSSKRAKVKPSEEECGIWLDTKELKEKKQQKQRTRPISRLLNPLDRSGYSVAVALNFTQTKLNMPVTRQSSIATFFSPKSRDTHTGAKRKHGSLETTLDSSNQTTDMKQQNCDGDFKELSSKDKKEQHFLHLICGDESEGEQPPEKRRHVGHYTHQNVFETQEYWTKATQNESPTEAVPETEAFFHWESQNRKHSEEELLLSDAKNTHRPVLGVLNSVNENRKPQASDVTNKNQEQLWRKTKASPMKRMGKENIWPTSPIKTTSPCKPKLISSPAKCRLKEKFAFSPNRKSGKEHETLSALFTQDSEGLCVIAHREKEPEGNRHDRNRASSGEDESDPEMLFTQDSEGNMVIKH